MSRLDSFPKLKLTFEVSMPDTLGGPPHRYSISRTLKARWINGPEEITRAVLSEIKNYHGSFVGDLIQTLHSLVRSEHMSVDEEKIREFDVARYAASIIESLIFSSVRDEIHKDLLDNDEIFEWDGSTKRIELPSQNELKNVDIDKVVTLLTPKIKHALFLMSKDRS